LYPFDEFSRRFWCLLSFSTRYSLENNKYIIQEPNFFGDETVTEHEICIFEIAIFKKLFQIQITIGIGKDVYKNET
jgi:hypothetical protein